MHEIIPAGMRHLQLPIHDGSIPDAAWERKWKRESPSIHSVLGRGGKVCVHCMGGLGRSGIVAARLLVESGISSEQAILMVRAARPGAIETAGQEAYVRGLLTRSFFIRSL
jgi:protein-tyrosine phosphatase